MALGGGGGGGASASAIKAGAAFVELSTKDDGLKSGLDRAKAMVQSFAGTMAKVGAGLAAAGGAILAPITKLVLDSIGGAAEMKSMADRFGVAVETMSTFAFAAQSAGVDTEELSDILTQFARHVHEAATGSGELAEKFAAAGLNAADLAQMTPVDQVLAFAEAMQHTANATERLALETELGGRSFSRLDSLLRKGPAGIRERMAMGKSFGAEVSEEEAAAAKTIRTEWNLTKAALREAFGEIGDQIQVVLAGPFKSVMEIVREAAKSFQKFASEHQTLIVGVAALGASLVALGTACLGVSAAITVVSAAWAGLVAVASALAALFAFILTPAGLIVAALAAIAAAAVYLATATETGRAAVSALWGTFKEAFGGVVDALKAGEFQTAAAIAWEGVKYVWAKGTVYLTQAWNSFKAEVVDGWHQIAEASQVAWERLKFHASPTRTREHLEKNLAEIRAEFAAEQRVRDAARADDLASAEQDALNAKKRIDELNAGVQARAAKRAADEKKSLDAQVAAVGAQVSAVKFGGAAGSFGGRDAALQFGAMLSAGPLVQAAKETAKNTGELVTEAKKRATWRDEYGTLTLEYD